MRRVYKKAGFSVLELLVTVLILSLALSVAARLLLEAERRSFLEHSRNLDPALPLLLRQLRVDVAAARSGTGDAASGEPMTLVWPSGLRITYELKARQLLRKVSNSAGERVLLEGVKNFSYRWSGGKKPLAVIEIEYEKSLPSGPDVRDAERVFVPRGTLRQTFQLALRGGQGVGW